MKMIEFEGHYIAIDKILGVSEVTTFDTGPRVCDWAYGFNILFDGNTLPLMFRLPDCGYMGGPKRKDEFNLAKKKREELIKQLESEG